MRYERSSTALQGKEENKIVEILKHTDEQTGNLGVLVTFLLL